MVVALSAVEPQDSKAGAREGAGVGVGVGGCRVGAGVVGVGFKT